MRGHVRKRGSKWCVVVDVGRDPTTNRRKQRWHSGYRTRKDAQQALTDILSRLDRGAYVEPSKETVAEFLDEWLQAIKARVRPSTNESYARNIRVHITPRLGSTRLQALTPGMLNAFYADLLTNGRKNSKTAGLSPRTVRYIHTILRKALADAARWNKLSRNPADTADPPAARSARAKEMRTWSAEELRSFLVHVRDDRLYALWILAGTSGMRRGELAGLRWDCINLDDNRVSIRRTLISVGYRVEWSEPKTQKGRRSIAIDPATAEALRLHRLQQARERELLGDAYTDDDLVFAQEDGQPLHPERISKLFEQHAKAASLPQIRFHDLRHTHATLALQAGIHPKVVSERLGHADIALTLNTYSHAIPALEETAAALIASLVLND